MASFFLLKAIFVPYLLYSTMRARVRELSIVLSALVGEVDYKLSIASGLDNERP